MLFNCKKDFVCHFNRERLLKCIYKTTIHKAYETKEYVSSIGGTPRTTLNHNRSSQTTLTTRYLRKMHNYYIKGVPQKPEICSISNLERITSADENR